MKFLVRFLKRLTGIRVTLNDYTDTELRKRGFVLLNRNAVIAVLTE